MRWAVVAVATVVVGDDGGFKESLEVARPPGSTSGILEI